MSTRQMAQRFSKRGHGLSATGSADGGLLTRILGKDKITGGVSTNPETGELSYTPYQGSSGFLGAKSRARAADLNNQIGGSAYLQQQAAASRSKELKEKYDYDRAIQELQNAGLINNTEAKGLQDRLTVTEQGNQARQTQREAQVQKVATEDRVPLVSGADDKVYGNLMTDPRIQIAAKKAMMEKAALDDPRMQQSLTTGMIQNNLTPAYKNAATGTTITPPNNATVIPNTGVPGTGLNVFGGQTSQTIQEVPGTVLPNGTVINQPPKVTTQTGPARIQQQIPAELIQRAIANTTPSAQRPTTEPAQQQLNPTGGVDNATWNQNKIQQLLEILKMSGALPNKDSIF